MKTKTYDNNHGFKVGDKISIHLFYDDKTRTGRIVHIFKAQIKHKYEDVIKYGEFDEDIPIADYEKAMAFRHLSMPSNIDRIVIEHKPGRYFLMPWNNRAAEWTLHMPSEEECRCEHSKCQYKEAIPNNTFETCNVRKNRYCAIVNTETGRISTSSTIQHECACNERPCIRKCSIFDKCTNKKAMDLANFSRLKDIFNEDYKTAGTAEWYKAMAAVGGKSEKLCECWRVSYAPRTPRFCGECGRKLRD